MTSVLLIAMCADEALRNDFACRGRCAVTHLLTAIAWILLHEMSRRHSELDDRPRAEGGSVRRLPRLRFTILVKAAPYFCAFVRSHVSITTYGRLPSSVFLLATAENFERVAPIHGQSKTYAE